MDHPWRGWSFLVLSFGVERVWAELSDPLKSVLAMARHFIVAEVFVITISRHNLAFIVAIRA